MPNSELEQCARRAGGTHQNRSERDAFARIYEDRVTQLRDIDERLAFGRLELDGIRRRDEPTHRYIGRIGLRDEDQQPLLLDWRVPQARAVLPGDRGDAARRARAPAPAEQGPRASCASTTRSSTRDAARGRPGGLQGEARAARRAHRPAHGPHGRHRRDDPGRAGPHHPLRPARRARRAGRPGHGQDRRRAAPRRLPAVLAPRAARHPGVLIVGPSRSFLQYIEAVLPSLGETGVVLASRRPAVPGHRGDDEDDARRRRAQGPPRDGRPHSPRRALPADRAHRTPQKVDVNGERLTRRPRELIRVGDAPGLGDAQAAQRRAGRPSTRPRSPRSASSSPISCATRATRSTTRPALPARRPAHAVRRQGRAQHRVAAAHPREAAAGPLRPPAVARVAHPALDGRAARPAAARPRRAVHDRATFRCSTRRPSCSAKYDARTTRRSARASSSASATSRTPRAGDPNMDVEGLVDAESLAASFEPTSDAATTARARGSDRTWTYGHIVVDEAQELSPMQWRLLLRRGPRSRSRSSAMSPRRPRRRGTTTWQERCAPLRRATSTGASRSSRSTTARRQIAEVAERFAIEWGLPVTPSKAVRSTPWAVAHADDVVAAVSAQRTDEARGTLAVIALPERMPGVHAALGQHFGDVVGYGADSLLAPIVGCSARRMRRGSSSTTWSSMTRPPSRPCPVGRTRSTWR